MSGLIEAINDRAQWEPAVMEMADIIDFLRDALSQPPRPRMMMIELRPGQTWDEYVAEVDRVMAALPRATLRRQR